MSNTASCYQLTDRTRENARPNIQEELQTFQHEVNADLHGFGEVFSDVVDSVHDVLYLSGSRVLKLKY